MNGIEIFIDESGDFGPFSPHCPYYIVTMVFHDTLDGLYENIRDLEYRLRVLGLENHCIHSTPAIRGENEYFGMDIALRRKIITNLLTFIHHGDFRFHCFFAQKDRGCTEASLLAALKSQIDPFVIKHYAELSAYSRIEIAYDQGQKQISRLISETLCARFDNVTVTKTLPIQSRLQQVADLACSMKRTAKSPYRNLNREYAAWSVHVTHHSYFTSTFKKLAVSQEATIRLVAYVAPASLLRASPRQVGVGCPSRTFRRSRGSSPHPC